MTIDIKKPLKVCVVGCGYAAKELHIPAISKLLEYAKIVAVCDIDKELANKTAHRYSIPKVYMDLSDALKSKNIDIVDITTPPRTHKLLTIQAAEAGCHVIVEKPMCITQDDADAMITLCRRNNVKLCIDHNGLFNPAVLKAKQLIQTGFIGNLQSVKVEILEKEGGILTQQNHWCHSLPGGVMNEIASHAVYLVLAFLRNVNAVHAIGKKFCNYPWVNYDELMVLLEAENALGYFSVSCNSPRTSIVIDLFGNKGILHVDNFTMSVRRLAQRKPTPISLAFDNFMQSYQIMAGTAVTAAKTLFGLTQRSYFSLIRKFIESILNDSEVPITPEEGKETVRILEMIFREILKNQP